MTNEIRNIVSPFHTIEQVDESWAKNRGDIIPSSTFPKRVAAL